MPILTTLTPREEEREKEKREDQTGYDNRKTLAPLEKRGERKERRKTLYTKAAHAPNHKKEAKQSGRLGKSYIQHAFA